MIESIITVRDRIQQSLDAEAAAEARAEKRAALIKAVREHAEEHYNDGGWDYVAECWTDADILHAVKGANTARGAIRKVAQIVSVIASREADAVSNIF